MALPVLMEIHEEDIEQIQNLCVRLQRDSAARAVLLFDKNGQTIADAGDTAALDVVSLASLTASNVAATGAIAGLLGENEFGGQYHEGRHVNVLVTLIAERLIMTVLFEPVRTNLGLVKLRVKKVAEEMTRLFDAILARSAQQSSILNEITDDDIDNLFKD